MKRGVVKWFDNVKGYGFIQSDDAEKTEYFVHSSEVVGNAALDKGQRVQFDVGQGKKGPMARNVQPDSDND